MSPLIYRPLTLSELVAIEIPPRKDLVEELLPEGQLTLFSGREKSGKTLIATDLACCIALAQPFLGKDVRPGPVIFAVLEENIRDVRDRLLKRLGNLYVGESVPLQVLPVNGYGDAVLRLDQIECVAALAHMIDEHAPCLVVIDPFRETHGLRENDSDDMAALIRPVRQIAHAKNCVIVLIHHMGWSGHARGSTAISAGVDLLWTFQSPDAESRVVGQAPAGTLMVKGRYGPTLALGISMTDDLRWSTDGGVINRSRGTRQAILRCIRAHPDGLDAHEIAGEIGVSDKTVQNEITALLKQEPCPLVVEGKATNQQGRRFRLVESASQLGISDDIIPPEIGHRGLESGIMHRSGPTLPDLGNSATWIIPGVPDA
jgi:hypothetical protein